MAHFECLKTLKKPCRLYKKHEKLILWFQVPVYLHKHLDVTQILELHAALLQTYVEQVKEAVNIMILIALVI